MKGRERSGALSGLIFAVLFVAGVILLGELLDFGESDAHFERYFASGSNRLASIVGGFLLAASGLAFLWFLSHLHKSLRPPEGRSTTLPFVMSAAGVTFVVLLLASSAALVTVPFAIAFGNLFDGKGVLVTGKALLPQLGFVLLAVCALWAAGLMVVAATISGRRSGMFPRWLGILGFVVAGVMFLLFASGLGLFALPAWVLAVGLFWFQKTPRDTT